MDHFKIIPIQASCSYFDSYDVEIFGNVYRLTDHHGSASVIKGCVVLRKNNDWDNSYGKVTRHFNDYFEDWKNPTEAEMVAFCLEFGIDY